MQILVRKSEAAPLTAAAQMESYMQEIAGFSIGMARYDAAIAKQQSPQQALNGPIPSAIGQLGEAISMLAEAVEQIEKRLDTVLTPEPPSTDAKIQGNHVSPAPPLMSRASEDLQFARARVEQITARAHRLLNRMEL